MSPVVRKVVLVVAIVLALVGVWQFYQYTTYSATGDYTRLYIAIGIFAAAGAALVAFFLTKPEEDISDISITKF